MKGTKKKTQKAINEEIGEQWATESDKRNRYFSKFGITTVTFTDADLKDIDACFATIAEDLSERAEESTTLDYRLKELVALDV